MSTYITTPAGIAGNEVLSKFTTSDKLIIIHKNTDKIAMSDHVLLEKTKAKKEYIEIANRDEMLVVIGSLLSPRTKFVVLDKGIPVPSGLMDKYDISYQSDKKPAAKKTTRKKAEKPKEEQAEPASDIKELKAKENTPEKPVKAKKATGKKKAVKEDPKPEEQGKEEPSTISLPEKEDEKTVKSSSVKETREEKKPKRTRKKKAAIEDIQVSDKFEKELENALNKPEEEKPAAVKKKSPFATSIKSSEELFDNEDAIIVSKRTGIRASDLKEKIDEEALMLIIADEVRKNESDDDLKFALKTRFDSDDFVTIWKGVKMGLRLMKTELT